MSEKNRYDAGDEIIDILGALDVSENTQNQDNILYNTPAIEEELAIINKKVKKQEIFNLIKTKTSSYTISLISIFKRNIQKAQSSIQTRKKTPVKPKTKKPNSRLLSAGLFGLKYALTSVGIFGVLLLSTNYSAYSNIAKSYIFKDQIAQNSESLLNLVNAGAIEEINTEEEKIVKKSKTEKLLELELNKKQANIKEDTYSINRLLSTIDKEGVDLGIDIVPYENRIIIPKIAKSIPLIEVKQKTVENETELNDIFMKELEEGIVRYPGSAKPGDKGNSFVFGHSSNFPWIKGDYNDVFARLGQVNKEDVVIAYYGQKKYKYKIKEKRVITPKEVDILKRNKDKSELTLMTCWPVGTTLNRLILIGELVEE